MKNNSLTILIYNAGYVLGESEGGLLRSNGWRVVVFERIKGEYFVGYTSMYYVEKRNLNYFEMDGYSFIPDSDSVNHKPLTRVLPTISSVF